VIVMPDHVHLIVMPYENSALAAVLRRMKGASSWFVNRHLATRGTVWQRESFDRIVRSEESLEAKREYLLNNPVRAGLVARWGAYPWFWFPR
jgi:REP element-mobilizing transposase RayT